MNETIKARCQTGELDRDKVVKNLSERPLSNIETDLTLGLNFSVTPTTTPVADFITGIESAAGKLPPEMTHDLKTEVKRFLIKKKSLGSNLGIGEREALRKLREDNTIVILPADKGNVMVVMDRRDYQRKMQVLLEEGSYRTRRGTGELCQKRKFKRKWRPKCCNFIRFFFSRYQIQNN